HGRGFPEELIDRVILDPRRKETDLGQHPPAERLVPAEVALHVYALRALLLRLPDRLADGPTIALHRVIAGDHARALVAEDADGQTQEPRPPHRFGAGVERIGIAEANERRHVTRFFLTMRFSPIIPVSSSREMGGFQPEATHVSLRSYR